MLLWNHYVVPQWHLPYERFAVWDMYKGPSTLPARNPSFMRVWWWDEAAAKRQAESRG